MGAVFTTLVEDYNTIFSYRLPSQNQIEDSSDEEEPFMVYVNASTRIVNIDTSDSDWTWPTGTPPPPTHWSQGPPQLQTSWSPGPPPALWAARISTLELSFLAYKEFFLWLMRIFNRQNNRSCSSHFFYDEWQYCFLEQSQFPAAPAGSGTRHAWPCCPGCTIWPRSSPGETAARSRA